MDFKTYDTAFVEKLGAAKAPPQKGYWLTVPGIPTPVPCLFDLPEEWWSDKIGKTVGVEMLPAVNVKRVDLIPDAKRFMPAFRGKEVSQSDPNTINLQRDPAQPVTILYEVQMAADSQHQMNALLQHALLKLPTAGYGTALPIFGHYAPFRQNSVRNYAWNMGKEDGRKFMWGYTYAVEGWITTTECVKVPQILQVEVTVTDGAGAENTVVVTES